MNGILNFFNQGWVGALIGILGLIAAYLTYRGSRIGPRLVYQWKSLKIISKDNRVPEDIEIKYKGKSVPRLIKTQIVFWNSGKQTINGEDIVKGDPLKMEFLEGEEIVSANIEKVTREINKFSLLASDNEENKLYFKFDFLDPNDGAVIEVLHTDNNRYPQITGTIKGMPQGILNWSNKKKKNKVKDKFVKNTAWVIHKTIYSRIGNILILILGVVFYLISFYYLVDYTILSDITGKSALTVSEKKVQSLSWFLIGTLYSSSGGFLLWSKRRRFPKPLHFDSQDTI